ncbi:MAG: four helix bundle protein, partial [Pyrinomonadaceae bacterium]|nr:four helix bundle protein [Pyrinomonadaceae bacterium]
RNPLWQKDVRLSGQIQAASVSVLSNIAEGFVRHSDKEFAQFLFIAMSSAAETQSHAYVALDQKYLSQESFDAIYAQAGKTSRIISGLIKYLRNKAGKTRWTRQTTIFVGTPFGPGHATKRLCATSL